MAHEDIGLLRALGGSVGKWLHEALLDSDEDQREATARVERMYAFVDLMMLAILADGSMRGEEMDVLEARLGEAKELELSIGEARARIQFKTRQVDTPEKMRLAMRAAINRLHTQQDRDLAYQLAAELRNAGARLGTKRGGYRQNLRYDEGLLNLFAEMLGVSDQERDRLESAALPRTFDT